MKKHWQTLAALVVGLALGMAWRPYNITPIKLGSATGLAKANRITGTTWISLPGDTRWRLIEHNAPTSVVANPYLNQ